MRGVRTVLRSLGLAALLGSAIAAPAPEKRKAKGFLKQLDDTTWVLGNDLWNLTQGRQYATKLMYKGQDLVDEAVGHYVSYSE